MNKYTKSLTIYLLQDGTAFVYIIDLISKFSTLYPNDEFSKFIIDRIGCVAPSEDEWELTVTSNSEESLERLFQFLNDELNNI